VGLAALTVAVGGRLLAAPPAADPPPAKSTLRAPSAFSDITDAERRSAALFSEAGKVLTHPRCVNCHPNTDRPLQGETGSPHEPRVRRGAGGFGVPAMRCTACHTSANYDPAGIPGNPHWHLAPASMAWEGLSVRQICEQLKDPARNGGRTLASVVEHMKKDPLVGWAWAPGVGREPAPGTQAGFASLIAAWARTGAACPES
jgi:hypothetical protein